MTTTWWNCASATGSAEDGLQVARAVRAREAGRAARAQPGSAPLPASPTSRRRSAPGGGRIPAGPGEDPALAEALTARAGDPGDEHGRGPPGPPRVGHEASTRRQYTHPGAVPPLTERPNDLWTADFNSHFRTRYGICCYPLTVADQHTRYLLGCHGLLSTQGQECAPSSIASSGVRAARRHSHRQRRAVRHHRHPRLSQLNVWWLRLGGGKRTMFFRNSCCVSWSRPGFRDLMIQKRWRSWAKMCPHSNTGSNPVGATISISLNFLAPCLRNFRMFLKHGIHVSGLRASRSRLNSRSASASPAPRRTTPRA
jgi:hypothetical protein